MRINKFSNKKLQLLVCYLYFYNVTYNTVPTILLNFTVYNIYVISIISSIPPACHVEDHRNHQGLVPWSPIPTQKKEKKKKKKRQQT